MARDIAQRFNHTYGHEFFVMTEALIEEQVATLPGLDGRKMSKSYDNTIPLFEGGPKALREAIMKIVTDSRAPGEPKDTEDSALFTIYKAFASPAETAAFADSLHGGMGWGEAKQLLFDRVDAEVAPMRERYDALMASPGQMEDILLAGAAKARAIAGPLVETLREAVGLRSARHKLATREAPAATPAVPKAKPPRFASFRDSDGSFRFRLFGTDGEELLLSVPFADPKAAGSLRQALSSLGGAQAVVEPQGDQLALLIDGKAVAHGASHADEGARAASLARLREALDALAAATAEEAATKAASQKA
jgi:tryptophanyl-tRNA synthetase